MENNICAPGIEYTGNSCISIDLLEKMINAYNNHIQDKNNEILIDKNTKNMKQYNPTTYKKTLINLLDEKLSNKCTNQLCWIGLSVFKHLNKQDYETLTKYTFKPDGPTNHEWLSNIDIEKIFAQYENYYENFKFLGSVPRDFDDMPEYNFSNLNYDNYIKQGKTLLGLIINHDYHNMSGSHWVALFVDLLKGKIYYSDSVGRNPKKEVRYLIGQFEKYFKNKNIKFETKINNYEQQQGDSECGVYSVNFILRLLDGETFDEILNYRMRDEEVQLCRKEYFRGNKNKKKYGYSNN